MTAKKTAWAVFAIAAALILVIFFSRTAAQSSNAGSSPETSAATTGQQPGQDSKENAAAVDRGNGFSQPSPDADQAPQLGTPMQYERQEITAPPVPTPDTQDPAKVAGAFLTLYNSRTSETDQDWKTTTKPWTTSILAQELHATANAALTGKAPAAVSKVKIGDHIKEWGADTPLRWSHQAQVSVATQDQGSYLLEYRLQAQLTDQGWLINAAKLDSWQRVEK